MSYLWLRRISQLKDPPVSFPGPQSCPLGRSADHQGTFIREPTAHKARRVMLKTACSQHLSEINLAENQISTLLAREVCGKSHRPLSRKDNTTVMEKDLPRHKTNASKGILSLLPSPPRLLSLQIWKIGGH